MALCMRRDGASPLLSPEFVILDSRGMDIPDHTIPHSSTKIHGAEAIYLFEYSPDYPLFHRFVTFIFWSLGYQDDVFSKTPTDICPVRGLGYSDLFGFCYPREK